MKGFQ